MKNLAVLIFALGMIPASAQVGIGTTNPNAHAVLDLRSANNNQGLLMPSLSKAQRTASAFTGSLGSADGGLVVYDTDDKIFYYWNGSAWAPIQNSAGGSGTVTNINTGTGLTGGPIATSGTVSLSNTTVVPATYGSATQVGQFTVDAQGRITNAGSITISGVAPTGAAGGDLTGNYPSPTVAANAITSTKILDATIATADLAALSVTDAKIASGITPSKVTPGGTNGQVLTTVGGTTAWAALPASGTGTVTSIVAGTGLAGGTITTTGTISLPNTGVTAGSYGSGTQVPTFVVDAQGRITSVKPNTITGSFTLPYAGTGTTTTNLFSISTTGTGAAVYGTNTTTKYPTSGYLGSASYGVFGTHQAYPVYGVNSNGGEVGYLGAAGYGVYGSTTAGNYGYIGNNTYLVFGAAVTATATGVYGSNSSNKYASNGYLGSATYGVFGTNQNYSVYGKNSNTGDTGWLGGGGYGVFSQGQAGGTTTWSSTSDARYKRNITPLSSSLEKILQMRGVGYDWRTDEFPQKHFSASHDVGVIAQELKSILPEAVLTDADGYYSVSYEKIIPLLIEAIKQQQAKIEVLENENASLNDIRKRIAALEALLTNTASSVTPTAGTHEK